MPTITIAFLDRALVVEAAESIAPDIGAFFQLCTEGDVGAPTATSVVADDGAGKFNLDVDGKRVASGLARGEVIERLAAHGGMELSFSRRGVPIRAGAVAWAGKAVLVATQPGSGQTSLVAWFIEKGFAYIAEDNVSILDGGNAIAGMPQALAFRRNEIGHLATLPSFRDLASVIAGEDRLLIRPDITWMAGAAEFTCGLIVLARHKPNAEFGIEALPPETATFALLEQTRSVVIPSDPQYPAVRALAESAPAFRITYGNYAQLDGVLDFLARLALENDATPAEVTRLVSGLTRPATFAPRKTFPIPPRSDRRFSPKLTIGMATYDDFDGVYFTLQGMRLYHPEVLDDVEFVIIDNHPEGPASPILKNFEKLVPNYRYIPVADMVGNAVKGRVFEEAGGEFVMCMDCHILIVPGAIRRLLQYFAKDPMTRDLLQGPIIDDTLKRVHTHYEPKWTGGFYGVWGHDPAGDDPEGPPFDIVMQNTGLFACRRAAWPGFNPLFRGFVPEEGYIHQKFRNAGGRTLCLPFFRCIHRFHRPVAVPYPMTWDDRIRNHIIGLYELGLPIDETRAHFHALIGAEGTDKLIEGAQRELGVYK